MEPGNAALFSREILNTTMSEGIDDVAVCMAVTKLKQDLRGMKLAAAPADTARRPSRRRSCSTRTTCTPGERPYD